MGNPFPANFETPEGSARLEGQVNFTDPANQPSGGSLPAQWSVDANGALNITLTGASGDFDFAHALRIFNSDGTAILILDSSGEVSITANDPSAHALTAFVGGNEAFDVDNDFVRLDGWPTLTGTGIHSAPADGAINDGQLSLWFDQTNGAAKLKIKAKTQNGTVVTGEIPLA